MSPPDSLPDLALIAELDRTVHEPARLMILAQLSVVEAADALFLLRQTGLSWGNLSSHLSKLEAAGYIRVKKEFVDRRPHTMIQLSPAGRRAFRVYREKLRRVSRGLPG